MLSVLNGICVWIWVSIQYSCINCAWCILGKWMLHARFSGAHILQNSDLYLMELNSSNIPLHTDSAV